MVEKTKVVVLGGGLGSMAAAYELTCTPALRERYEVTVVQHGWRLGGKGASGREKDQGQRILEHGLHAFLGFYENAFALMRDLYRDWAHLRPTARWTSWRDAFTPQRMITIQEELEDGWAAWSITLPKLPGEPGDGHPAPLGEKLVAAILQLWLDWVRQLIKTEPRALGRLLRSVDMTDLSDWRALLAGDVTPLLDEVREALEGWEDASRLDDDVRRLVNGVQLGAAILRGLLTDVLPRGEMEGFAYIDQWDFKDWLMRHGANEEVAFWGPVRALYDLGFAYEGGGRGRDHARAAAGVTLRILLLLGFGYKDAPLWKLNAGMGDTIFSPVYEVLKSRGVRFEFFTRVTNLGLSGTGNLVQEIELSSQVELIDDYEPLIDVKGLPCWPSEPLWEQVVDGATIAAELDAKGLSLESAWCAQSVGTKTLRLGDDYDLVVCGISVGALKDIAPELIDARDEWRRMLATTKTVQTESLQLWFLPTTRELGWRDGTTIMTGYVEPFDSWGDLSHLLPEEDWPEPGAPKSLGYFCNAFPDADPIPPYSDEGFPEREDDRVFEDARVYLAEHAGHLWPNATEPGNPKALDLSKLHDPAGGTGLDRLKAQHWQANVDPGDRYVLSVPGSVQYRLWAGRSGFLNLYLAGDWVQTSINAGCAEAATEGGLRAAHAIIGFSPRPFTNRHLSDDVTPAEGD